MSDRREVELALRQKQQADELVDVLTRRCDELRRLLAQERQDRELVFQDELLKLEEAFDAEMRQRELAWQKERSQLEQRCLHERQEKARVANKLGAALDKVQQVERTVHELRKENAQYRAVAQAAVTEAREVVAVLGTLSEIKKTSSTSSNNNNTCIS